jgi:nitroreductase
LRDVPTFGEPLPVVPSPEVLAFLARRRSASAQTLKAPGPDPAAIDRLITLAARVPDHGKLTPWRFIVLEGEAKRAFVAAVERLGAARGDAEKALGALIKLRNPPASVVVVSRPSPGGKIPVWEQELSAGSVCMTLLIAAQAAGYGANWITDWYSDDADVLALLGVTSGERVAGYVHLGSPGEAPLERVRPQHDAILTRWSPQAGL